MFNLKRGYYVVMLDVLCIYIMNKFDFQILCNVLGCIAVDKKIVGGDIVLLKRK